MVMVQKPEQGTTLCGNNMTHNCHKKPVHCYRMGIANWRESKCKYCHNTQHCLNSYRYLDVSLHCHRPYTRHLSFLVLIEAIRLKAFHPSSIVLTPQFFLDLGTARRSRSIGLGRARSAGYCVMRWCCQVDQTMIMSTLPMFIALFLPASIEVCCSKDR